MSVTTVKKKNNMLGGLGTIAQVGGLVTGQPWLTALGTGLSGLNSQMNGGGGNNGDATGALSEILDGLNGAWQMLSSGNIGKVHTKDMTDEQLVNKWQPHVGGYGNLWQYPQNNSWMWGGNI